MLRINPGFLTKSMRWIVVLLTDVERKGYLRIREFQESGDNPGGNVYQKVGYKVLERRSKYGLDI